MFSKKYHPPHFLYDDRGGVGLGKLLFSSALAWFAGGKYHSRKVSKKVSWLTICFFFANCFRPQTHSILFICNVQLKNRFQKEQKQLYTQYYNDVYKLSEQNQELTNYIEQLTETLKTTEAKHELEALQRDYEEFKQPDIDGDERISRAEFNMYIKNYLANYPGLSEKDYPKFEDFDHDGDGFVSFQEYSQQMALQAQQAEADQLYGDGSGSQKAQAMQGLYDSTMHQF